MPPTRVAPLAPDDLAGAGRLFTDYPYKTAQQAAQKIDRGRLDAFFVEGLGRAVEAGKPHWAAWDGDAPVALAGLAGPTWQSEIYGLRMGRIEPWLNTAEPAAGADLLATVESAARERGFEHLAARVDAQDFPNLHLFESHGWRTVDASMKFSRRMPPPKWRTAPQAAAGLTIATASPDDAEWIRRLGSTTHAATHYLNDPDLPTASTHALFAEWLDRCLARLAYRVYTLKNADGQGLGFVTYLQSAGFARAVGRRPLVLDFVLLDPALRGAGLGPWFIHQTLERERDAGFDYCELRTSLHNLPAVGCYEKLGFNCCAGDFALHKRFDS